MKTVQISIRVDRQSLAAVDAMARREDRTRSQMIRILLAKGTKQQSKKHPGE